MTPAINYHPVSASSLCILFCQEVSSKTRTLPTAVVLNFTRMYVVKKNSSNIYSYCKGFPIENPRQQSRSYCRNLKTLILVDIKSSRHRKHH